MSPLLPSLLLLLLAEFGGGLAQAIVGIRAANLSATLLLRALAIVTFIVMTIAALGAYAVTQIEPMAAHASMLLLAIALAWAAFDQLRPLKPFNPAEGDMDFMAALRTLTRRMFSGGSGLLVFALGLTYGGEGDALAATALGGVFGVIGAHLAPLLATPRQLKKWPLGNLRFGAGALLLILALFSLFRALRLI